jgi:4-diphosphocytidyl-2-C-methyl-D-erythritol kinase
LATSRGEAITPLEWFPALQGAFVLLIHPGFGVATAWAYQALASYPEALHGEKDRARNLIEALQGSDLNAAGALFYNSLEAPVLRKFPILRLFQELLRDKGAAAALMSGSGSTTFALSASEHGARALEQAFRERFGVSAWTAVVPLESGFSGCAHGKPR